MEGLVRGLRSVDMLGDQSDNDESQYHHPNDDNNCDLADDQLRSRSMSTTWAQVVSGEHHGDVDDQGEHDDGDEEDDDDHPVKNDDDDQAEQDGDDDDQAEQDGDDDEAEKDDDDDQEELEESTGGWKIARKKIHMWLEKIRKDLWKLYKRPLSEQEYSEEVTDVAEPSEEELADYKIACEKLWELDFNRLTPVKDYEIDVGEGKKVYDTQDMADENLFTWVDDNVLRRPTFSRFCALLDNYNPYQEYEEIVTDQELQEQAAFIEEISRTAPIKYLYKYLSCNGLFTEDYQEFKTTLIDLWFTLYDRGGTSDSSSPFEHVFVGEIKSRGEQEVSGFHNWLQFYLEEANGGINYQGYILPRRHQEFPDAETQLLTVQFEWKGILKPLSSMFIGVSPEFEIALYTLCFFAGEEDNRIQVGPYPVNIKCYHMGDKIGSAFPIAES